MALPPPLLKRPCADQQDLRRFSQTHNDCLMAHRTANQLKSYEKDRELSEQDEDAALEMEFVPAEGPSSPYDQH